MFLIVFRSTKGQIQKNGQRIKEKWLQYSLEADLEYKEIYGNILYLLFFNLIHYDLTYGIYGMCTK